LASNDVDLTNADYTESTKLRCSLIVPLAIWISWNVGFVSIASIMTAYFEVVMLLLIVTWYVNFIVKGSKRLDSHSFSEMCFVMAITFITDPELNQRRRE
jgi:hypothetical protein